MDPKVIHICIDPSSSGSFGLVLHGRITMKKRNKNRRIKLAICDFQNRVCPRFDLTPEILIFDVNGSQEEPIEKVDVSRVPPQRIFNILAERGVGVVISGGIQKKFQEMFLSCGIEVIWGVGGEVHDVIQAYQDGALQAGMGVVTGVKKRIPSTLSNT